ncbi:MAG: hypothetical protein KDB33_01960, partial [Acidimicrobiales bacterium]|nr:hypothetical protein [Acidimicrobiales bacterium]
MATDAPLRDPVPRERELADVYDDLHVAYVRAPSPETAQLHLGRLGRRRRPARTRAAIVGGLASGLVVLTSVAASAGALPDPLQRAVAHAADAVGLTLP